MAEKDLKLEPHDISEDIWWYEEEKGINLYIVHVCPSGQRSQENHLIPWSELRAALKRKDTQ